MGHQELKEPKQFVVPASLKIFSAIAVVTGLLAFIIGYATGLEHASWNGYLMGFWFTLSLALAGPFIVATQHLAIAGWSVPIRRICMAFGTFIPLSFVLALAMIPGFDTLYHWMDSAYVAGDFILAKKAGFLNMNGLIITIFLTFAAWILVFSKLRNLEFAQDEKGDYNHTNMFKLLSCAWLVVFVIGFSFLSWYLIMGLEPHWFSTMFSVYAFAGMFQSGLAATIVVALWLRDKGFFGDYLRERQVHDLGQLLFGFTVFYMYIAFSQFLLIWYANIPEEAIWYVARGAAPDVYTRDIWGWATLALPIFKWLIPFFALLPQNNKKNRRNILRFVAFWIIFMQFFEVWYWIAPTAHGEGLATAPSFSHVLVEWGTAIGFVGLFVFWVARNLTYLPLIPKNDPFLHEAVKPHHHGVKPPKPENMVIS